MMGGTISLKTTRLSMRKYRPEDAKILYRVFGTDEKMYEYSGWNPYETEETAKETVQNFIDSYNNDRFYGWAIEYNGDLVGTMGAYDYDAEMNSIEIGFSIARAVWGNGFASEALKCVLAYLTEHEGIKTIHAWCASENIGSREAMLRAGMIQIGIEKDSLNINNYIFDKLIFKFYA